MKINTIILVAFLLGCTSVFSQIRIKVADDGTGRIYEGIGALSAGASSKLLMDYPPEVQDKLFDLLFKPKFGASLQVIKVEIGGDVNSTDGTEPSHAHTRTEHLNPDETFFQRGYEWMVLKEAKKRNPDIFTDCLEWGCPGWIGEGKYYSQDNADYIVSFIKGAEKYHNIRFDYTGIRNERPYDSEWIKLLRSTLDRNGLENVKIIAADVFDWNIADEMKSDRELFDAVHSVGIHYNERWSEKPYSSTETAQSLGKPLHNSEGGPWRGDWEGFEYLVKLYNRNYITGKATRVITWSLITSYYDNLSIPNSGLMIANTPWSGHFKTEPALWAAAHTTQFAEPGWRYVDGGCGLFAGGSFVTLRSGNDFSFIAETMDTVVTQTVDVSFDNSFKGSILHVWKSTKGKHEFEKQPDIRIRNNRISLKLEGKSVYSLTTTTGQTKGTYDPPADTPFPFPYKSDFDNEKTRQIAKYFIDQAGVFEIHKRSDGKGQCMKQVIAQQGNEWELDMHPFVSSIVGNKTWNNYEVQCDVNIIEDTGSALLMGRVTENYRAKNYPEGYWFKVLSNGIWALYAGSQVLKSGTVAFAPFEWHHLSLKLNGDEITVSVDNIELAKVNDNKFAYGLAGVGCDFNLTEFDNFEVK